VSWLNDGANENGRILFTMPDYQEFRRDKEKIYQEHLLGIITQNHRHALYVVQAV
jgi:hypothetical protein